LSPSVPSTSILLVAPESAALPVADALRHDLHAEVEMTPSPRSALASLRRNEFSLILIDESLATPDTASADLIYQNAGGALVVELNFAISSAARIVRQTRAALARRTQDRAQARAAAAAALQGELNATLAGILLESQLALREASPAQAPKLRHLVQLAGDLRDRLRV
jgi:signal transduction histidine kinase